MRIAFLSTFYPFRGGIAQFNANLYEEMGRHHEVKAFTFTCQYPSFLFPGKTQYVTPEDKAVQIDSEAVLHTANPFSWWSAARKIAAWKPDLVIMKYWMSYLAPSLGTVARLLRKKGIRVLTILDNVIPHEAKFFDKPFSCWFLKQNDSCVAMSEAVRADARSLAPEVPCALQAHPLYDHFGQKTDKFAAREALFLDPDLRTLLFFGLIRDYKGLDLLIDAMPLLGEGYQLVIAGESYGKFDKYESRIAATGLGANIKVFNRYIDDEEVPRFFSAADVCVLPYKSATQSGITGISLHFEVPVVATPVGGLAESVEGPGIGVMAREVSPEAIADAIRALYAAGPDSFTENIRKVKANLTWSAFAEALLASLPPVGHHAG
jgi:glycosyltransferase involved in cell wall biosynthesis